MRLLFIGVACGSISLWCVQSARYLLKNLLGSQTGRAPQGSAAYLGNAKAEMKSKCEVSKAKQWREPGVQLAALRYCAVHAVLCMLSKVYPPHATPQHADFFFLSTPQHTTLH